MSSRWAKTWRVELDTTRGTHELHWTDADGRHRASLAPPGSGLAQCDARTVTPARQDLLCGRISGHDGSHASIGPWRVLGAVAE